MALQAEEIRTFYDKFGGWQDTQSFYERSAVRRLIEYGAFGMAESVFELGCGTGRIARDLLAHTLPANARYLAVDVSGTMVGLARERLASFGARAEVRQQAAGDVTIPAPDASMDRVISTYVLDLLPPDLVGTLFTEAARVLRPGGRLCLASLGCGETMLGRTVTHAWEALYRLAPGIVGGCHPIRLDELIPRDRWRVLHFENVRSWGITSGILVAEPR